MSGQLLDWELQLDTDRRKLYEVPTDDEGHSIHLTEGEIRFIQQYEIPTIKEEYLTFVLDQDCGYIGLNGKTTITINSRDIKQLIEQLDKQGYTLQKKETV